MTQQTNLQALCAEQLPELRGMFERILCVARSSDGPTVGHIQLADQLIDAVVSWSENSLAQPEPEGPVKYNKDFWRKDALEKLVYAATAFRLGIYSAEELEIAENRARFFLARWGRPTIEPVPVAERPWEREGWCDAEGRCWLHRPAEIPCRLENGTLYRWVLDTPCRDEEEPVHDTHCLPHHALPVPTTH